MVTRSGEPSSGSSARSDDDAPRPVRLGLLDDHELLLDSMSSWIQAHAPDFELVVRAGTWMELVTSTVFPTQLVIMDFELREPISIEARIRTCRAAGATVVVLSEREDDEVRERSLRAGAARHLTKAQPLREVMESARSAMEMRSVAGSPAPWRPLPIGVPAHQRPRLSAGELEALRLYVAGASTPEVAARMNVQFETAKTYLRRVRQKYVKIGRPASRRAELIRRAAEDGFLE
ncbi:MULTISPECIES: helix-turn-helix transcriptional regulator [unclassified Rathayibacter]|uniref:helix-turn-helix transcriptional regulator n=1 Tax=unclassified Rathayibacter TaxID=2609250 RepID=UPI0006F58B74|nr:MULTISPECIES: response regulator transcription factor [unclassified Rathayibacter]KQQ03909.1 two-component system response regulator [Rathayibacter sp. Leaf294]KQS12364.1 two-component system response regulator [Rathayibacter sp. Leaf185]